MVYMAPLLTPDIPSLGPGYGHSATGDLMNPHTKLEEKIDKCTLCGSRLEKGYITSSQSLEWRTQIIQRSPGEKLTRMGMAGRGFNIPAYRCKACGFIAALERR